MFQQLHLLTIQVKSNTNQKDDKLVGQDKIISTVLVHFLILLHLFRYDDHLLISLFEQFIQIHKSLITGIFKLLDQPFLNDPKLIGLFFKLFKHLRILFFHHIMIIDYLEVFRKRKTIIINYRHSILLFQYPYSLLQQIIDPFKLITLNPELSLHFCQHHRTHHSIIQHKTINIVLLIQMLAILRPLLNHCFIKFLNLYNINQSNYFRKFLISLYSHFIFLIFISFCWEKLKPIV